MTLAKSLRLTIPTFVFLSSVVLFCSLLIVRSSFFAANPEVLSWAVSLDITVLLPTLYVFLARRIGWPRISAIPVFLLSLLLAHAVLPAGYDGVLGLLGFAAAPLELLAVLFVAYKTRQVIREYQAVNTEDCDFLEALELALSRILVHPRVVPFILTEVSVIHYGLVAWRKRFLSQPGRRVFTYHVNSGYGAIMSVFLFLILVETTLLHVVLLPLVAPLAWILIILSVYGVIFLLADYNSARLRPIRIEDELLHVRIGLRWRITIRMEDISRIDVTSMDIENKEKLLKAVLIPGHNVVIGLRRSYLAKGLYGITKEFDRITLAVDDINGFVEAINQCFIKNRGGRNDAPA